MNAFSPEEVHALLRAAGSQQDAALFLTAAFTGLRLGELLALRWRDIDFAGEVIRVSRSFNAHGGLGTPKSGKVRSVPMVAEVARAFATMSNRDESTADGDLVFPGTGGAYLEATALRARYKTALARAGVKPLRFHDLRHTFGTLAVRHAEVPAVQAWMGHSDIRRRCATCITAIAAARQSSWRRRSRCLPVPSRPQFQRKPNKRSDISGCL